MHNLGFLPNFQLSHLTDPSELTLGEISRWLETRIAAGGAITMEICLFGQSND